MKREPASTRFFGKISNWYENRWIRRLDSKPIGAKLTRHEGAGDLDLLDYDEICRSHGWEVVDTVDYTWNGRKGRNITYEKKRAPQGSPVHG